MNKFRTHTCGELTRKFTKKDFKVVSIIGDGSMTGGLAFEAMNNAGDLKTPMLVILNDNSKKRLTDGTELIFHPYS